MLYNESTGKPKVEADVLSLESLIMWLETMPSGKAYDYYNCEGKCLLDQYANAMGTKDSFGRYSQLSDAFDRDHRIACCTPRTFGAALSRARKALAS